MDILIDTNVIINYLTNREDPFTDSSRKLMDLCSMGVVKGYIAFHTLSTIWYLLRRRPDAERRYLLRNICNFLTVASATQNQVIQALENRDFHDFEDCLQDKCAQNAGAEYLVTCNIKDFQNAETRIVTPLEMLNIIRENRHR